MTKAAYPTIGIAAFVMFVIVYFIGWLLKFQLFKIKKNVGKFSIKRQDVCLERPPCFI